MTPIEGLSLAPLSTVPPPAWLTPWMRADFGYALVQPIVSVLPGQAAEDGAGALVSLLSRLGGDGIGWYIVAYTAFGWVDTDIAAATREGARHAVASDRRVAVVVTAADERQPSIAGLMAGASAVLIVIDTWHGALLGAPKLLADAAGLGAHIQSDPLDPPLTIHAGSRATPRRRGRTRALAAATATAAVVIAAVVVTSQRTPDRPARATPSASASSPPSGLGQGGLLLPSASRFPGGRTGASAAFDPLTGSVTLFGGGRLGGSSSAELFPRDTWTWDANGWHRRRPSAAPPAGTDAAFAYDESTGSAILFGGIGSDGSTWQWNGLDWVRMHPKRHPGADVFAAAVYDPGRQSIVLATVCCQASPAGHAATLETWQWRNDDWVALRGRGAPVVSRAPLITYDLVSSQLLLLTQGSTPVSDTTDQITTTSALWGLDGMVWHRFETPRSPPYDPIRDRFGYDPASHQAVLFQGGDLATWAWTGSTWHELGPGGPSYAGALTTDATVGRILLFGGSVPSDDLSAIWTLESGRWKQVSRR